MLQAMLLLLEHLLESASVAIGGDFVPRIWGPLLFACGGAERAAYDR